ncbi:MAG: spore protease YyaC [Clostridia bacterium]|nr:MAG: spore protease YyaC [Clostridia bacterium]
MHHDDPTLVPRMAQALSEIISTLDPEGVRPLVIVAIGTDRSTGDALGPLTGSRVKELLDHRAFVYGTLEEPVHAGNLNEELEAIRTTLPNPLIIAIDACLGQAQSVGHITLAPGPLIPGAGVNKQLPAVGDIHLTGIVNVGGYMEYYVLQNTRLSLVNRMAEKIAACIYGGIQSARSLAEVAGMVQ